MTDARDQEAQTMTTTETVEQKAERMIAANRVHFTGQLAHPGGTLWDVIGDTDRYRVTVDDTGAVCPCAATGRCAHQIAAETMAYAATPNRSAAVADPGEPLQTITAGEIVEGAPAADPETGEIVTEAEATDALAVPADVPASGEIDVATAGLTWKTLVAISDTEFVGQSLRGRPAAILAAVRYGGELGIGPMASMSLVHILDGSPSLSAELQLRLYRRAGHTVDVVQADADAVELVGTRGDTGETMTIRYDLADAERAGLLTIGDDGSPVARSRRGNPMPWEQHTPDMLWARAVGRLTRRLAPDCLEDRTHGI